MCECSDKLPGYIKTEKLFNKLNNFQLLKEDHVAFVLQHFINCRSYIAVMACS